MGDMTKYVFLDTDMGADDAWALVLLLTLGKMMNIKVLAITCVFGNTDLPNVSSNTFKMLNIMGEKIPVFNGKSEPIIPDLLDRSIFPLYYGSDGFGEISPFINTTQLVGKDQAATVIQKLLKKYPKKSISYISLGPLTNLALALSTNEGLINDFKEIYLMGGNAFAYGFVREANTAEWNFHMDPEAAHIVLNEASRHNFTLNILPVEACLEENFLVTNEWRFNGPLTGVKSKVVDLLNKAEKHYVETYKPTTWPPADAILMACFLFPDQMIVKAEKHHARIELNGMYTRAQVAIERVNYDLHANVNFILQANATAYMHYILEAARGTECI